MHSAATQETAVWFLQTFACVSISQIQGTGWLHKMLRKPSTKPMNLTLADHKLLYGRIASL